MAGERILVVEDDPQALLLMTEILTMGEYVVLQATEAEQALELAGREKPDLILMDIQLPGMDGLAAAQKLRGNPATRSIPIAAVTSLELNKEQVELMVNTCISYIPKPISARVLMNLLPGFLAASKQRQEREKKS